MNVNQLKETVTDTFQYNLTTTRHEDKITPMIWGPPGVGKSDIVYQVAESLDYQVIELRLNSINPVDVRGFPYLDETTGKGQFALPYYFPREDENKRIIIFLDEINTALPTNQVTAYELCQNYAIGGKRFPQEVLIVGAGNREDDGGATFEMPMPLANRLQHLTVLPNKDAFVAYCLSKQISEDVVGFIQFKPGLLHEMNGTSKAFPSPRSWVKLASLGKFKGKFTAEMSESLVGAGAAAEFMSFLKVKENLPDMDKALAEGIPFQSKERSVMFSFVTALAYRLNINPTKKNLENYMKIAKVFPLELQVVSAYMMNDAVRKIGILELGDEFFEFIENSGN